MTAMTETPGAHQNALRVGFIGLGNMGRPMAENIAARGGALVVHDVRCAAAAELLGRGARWAESVRDLAAAADLVCLSLPGPPEFEAVMSGANGLAASLRPGTLVIDFTTNAPEVVRRGRGSSRRETAL